MHIFAKKFFHSNEILSKENFYLFEDRKKIITFIPSKFLEHLTVKMSNAGAGHIGNYEMCSFRTAGMGTYKPNLRAKPFAGEKNVLSYAEEIKLEMECSSSNLNNVLDALLHTHPYEEVAYEIYSFKKRVKKSRGIVIELKKKINLLTFLKRLHKDIEYEMLNIDDEFTKIAISDSSEADIFESAKFIQCEYLLILFQKNYKLFKLT